MEEFYTMDLGERPIDVPVHPEGQWQSRPTHLNHLVKLPTTAADSSFNLQKYLLSKLPKVSRPAGASWSRRAVAQRLILCPEASCSFFLFLRLELNLNCGLETLIWCFGLDEKQKDPEGRKGRAGVGGLGAAAPLLHADNAAVELS